MCMCVHVLVHVRVRVCVCVCAYVCVNLYICVCMYVFTYVCVALHISLFPCNPSATLTLNLATHGRACMCCRYGANIRVRHLSRLTWTVAGVPFKAIFNPL